MRPASASSAAALLAVLALSGCAYVGDPKPPTLDIPAPVTDLRAAEYGAKILVEFTLPPLTTEGLGLTGVQGAQLRAAAGGATRDYEVPVSGPGAERYDFPAQEWIGKQVTLNVRVTGPKGKASDWSNTFRLPVGPPLPPPSGMQATTLPEAVRLTWSASAPRYWVFRAVGEMPMAKMAEADTAEYVDRDVSYGTRYQYFVQALDTLLRQSELSEATSITPRDTFPPAAPAGLAGVPGVNSVELVWERSEENDFAGYAVYRSMDGGPFERIPGLLDAPTYSDRRVQLGHKYSYAVTAVDTTGNESARSAVIEVTAQ